MPDQWGRPTLNDGLQTAQAFMSIDAWNHQRQEFQRKQEEAARKRQIEEESYKVAGTLEQGGDISGFSDQAKYQGAKLRYDQDIQKLSKQMQEYLVSDQGRQGKLNELKTVDAEARKLYQQYQMARRSGNNDAAKKIAHKFNNEVGYTGIHVSGSQDGKLNIKRQMTGQDETVDDLSIEQYDQMLGGYMDVPQDEAMKRMLTGEQVRMRKNMEIIANAEPMINDKGNIIYKVPAGVIDKKDGSVRGAFYIDSPVTQQEVPASRAKEFQPFNVKAAQMSMRPKKEKATAVSPKDLVMQGNQAGLVVMGPSGQPSFQPVAGGEGLNTGQFGMADPSKAKSAYELQVKQLNTVLMPFNKTEAPIFEQGPDGNYRLAEGGQNALNAAFKLIQRMQQAPQSLSPEEKQFVPYASQAVQMYQQIVGGDAQSFGIQQGGVQQQQNYSNIPQPPANFELDK